MTNKPLKKSDLNKPWAERSAPSRKVETKSIRERFLIVCEGEKTEPNYFKSMRCCLEPRTIEVEISGEGANTLSLVEIAISLRDKKERDSGIVFDHTWIVFDRDSFKADNFDNAIYRAEANEINSAWSNEAFELWYLLHFQERTSAMSRIDYEGVLTKHLGEKYLKNDEKMYEKLRDQGDQDAAIRRAGNLRKQHKEHGTPPSRSNPCTSVDKLVAKLKPHLTREKQPANLEIADKKGNHKGLPLQRFRLFT